MKRKNIFFVVILFIFFDCLFIFSSVSYSATKTCLVYTTDVQKCKTSGNDIEMQKKLCCSDGKIECVLGPNWSGEERNREYECKCSRIVSKVVPCTITPTPPLELRRIPVQRGNANSDNLIDEQDYEFWEVEIRGNRGESQKWTDYCKANYCTADFNIDHVVDVKDYERWRHSRFD